MVKTLLVFGVILISNTSTAQEILKSTVRDVTQEYTVEGFTDFVPTPTPPPANPNPTISPLDINPNVNNTGGINTNPVNNQNGQQTTVGKINDVIVTIDRMITTGQKIWDFVVSMKPDATYDTFKASVVPDGITSWTQLNKWSKPVSKIFRVEFTNSLGKYAGSFDYRITYFHSGSYKGKGKFIAQISVVPQNIQLKSDRTFKLKVEIASVINFGDDVDPIAGAQLIISWATPTTTRYEMNSAEYMIYGNGEFQDLTNGN
jgi:hypothetical protein